MQEMECIIEVVINPPVVAGMASARLDPGLF